MSENTPQQADEPATQLERIEAKLDEIIAFNDRISALIAPYEPLLQGRGSRAMVAVMKAGGKL